MNPLRRALLLSWAAAAGAPVAAATPSEATASATPVRRGRALVFPRDHGAHLNARIEWWYATGWLGQPEAPKSGFQLTFFRSRTGLAADNASRFAPRHLLMAHAAVTRFDETGAARHHHEQRLVRWSGSPGSALGWASEEDADIRVGNWSLRRLGPTWHARLPGRDFDLDLSLTRSQPLLLQGDAGFSRKGPDEAQASHYYSEPQLAVRAADGSSGSAWLDHEWSEQLLHPQAVGWDWLGINLFDGSALTAFQLRRADGSRLWAGGSFRAAAAPGSTSSMGSFGTAPRIFAPAELQMTPGRRWRSPATGGNYPLQWTLDSPAGRFEVRALADAQELDGRHSSGTVYWEGLSELLDSAGRRVGLGYLEMTGYDAPMRLI